MRAPPPVSHLGLILAAAAGTLAVLAALWQGVRLLRPPPPPVPQSILTTPPHGEGDAAVPPSAITVPDIAPDTDSDGLPDALETLYRSDPFLEDTDGDGYLDGTEVTNGYDPTIPSPGDKITSSDQGTGDRGQGTDTAVPTFTEQFFSQTGAAPRPEALKPTNEQLTTFINDANARGYLATVADTELTITEASGKAAIAAYLDVISIPQNPKLHAVDVSAITTAFTTLTSTQNHQPLDDLITQLGENRQVLEGVTVPREVVELHKAYLGATRTLQENVTRLKDYRTDYVGALVAASRIEGVRSVFERVARDIQALESKYNIP